MVVALASTPDVQEFPDISAQQASGVRSLIGYFRSQRIVRAGIPVTTKGSPEFAYTAWVSVVPGCFCGPDFVLRRIGRRLGNLRDFHPCYPVILWGPKLGPIR